MVSAGTDQPPAEAATSSSTTPPRLTTSDSSSSTTQPTLAERTQLAAAEGPDVDEGEKRRRESTGSKRLESEIARQSTRGSGASQPEDVEKGAAAAGAAEVEDENVVWWDGPDDPENPFNWPTSKKVMTCALVSLFTFVTPLASCKCLSQPRAPKRAPPQKYFSLPQWPPERPN